MQLVAVVRAVASPEEAARALADAAGLAPAEARMRLAPEPPALLARLEPERAAALVAALRKAGLAALAVDARCPTDADRTLARSLVLDDEAAVVVVPRAGDPLRVPWGEVVAILRGARGVRTEVARTEKTTRFSGATTVITGGLWTSRTSRKTVRSADEAVEQVILLYARDGRAATLAETALDFSCLGAAMQPSSTANMVALAERLRARARAAFHDDRLVRLGRRALPFLAGGESRSQTRSTVTTRSDTSGTLDALAEVMRQALREGLLP